MFGLGDPAEHKTATDFMVGDVIQLNGPSVPVDLRDKYFRVESVDARGVKMSKPFLDAKLTQPYHPPRPTR